MDLTLFGWICGDKVDSIFFVKVSRADPVGALQDAIKAKIPEFCNLAAKDLQLYSIPSHEDVEAELEEWNPQGKTKLNVRHTLSKCFPEGNDQEWFIIVDAPTSARNVTERVPDMTLNCWVRGYKANQVFPVEISGTKTVGFLKEVIKSKKPVELCDVDADTLALYKVSVPCHEDVEDELGKWNPQGKTKLNVRHTLSKCFPEGNDQDWFIIVDAPASARAVTERVPNVRLNCWVRNCRANQVFPVDISSAETVGTLKKAIKGKKPVEFGGIDADTLALYKVSIPGSSSLEKTLGGIKLDHDVLLKPLDMVSDVFPGGPPQKHVHIVIEAPSAQLRIDTLSSLPSLQLHCVKSQRGSFLRASPKVAPSTGGKHLHFAARQAVESRAIHCNRPHTACGNIPVTLLHAAFGEFLDDCEKHEIIPDDNSLTEELHLVLSGFYRNEAIRADAIRAVFKIKALHIPSSTTNGGFKTDSDMVVNGHRYAIVEYKNEVGCTGAEPYNQACLYYLESTRDYAEKKSHSPLPCMIILLFGPYIAFAGATWNLRPVVQPLSVTLPMHFHSMDTDMLVKVARHLAAFKKAVCKLDDYCRRPEFNNDAPPPRRSLYPHPTSFKSLENDCQREFIYESQPFPEKLLFFGTIGDQPICVKFVRHYSKDVHLECASLGHAPKLLGFEKIPGGWFMVVMDRVIDMECPALTGRAISALLIDNMRNVLTRLHQNNYVHGDVRDANVMVSRSDENKFVFIDFDWAGKIGVARYPANLNVHDLWRPLDAVDGALIMADHDMAMLDHFNLWLRSNLV